MSDTTVKALINEISSTSQVRCSKKDEVRVMQAMLSDPSYEVTIYGNNGPEGTYNPTKDFRGMCTSILSNAAKISSAEAAQLMENYTPKKAEAEAMVNLSKEFVNTYLQSGRKMSLGSREKSDVSISLKHVEAKTRSYPMKIGVNDDGSDKYSKAPTTIPAHDSIRVYASCPDWVK